VDAYVHDGDFRTQKSRITVDGGEPKPILRDGSGDVQSLLPTMKFAYHLHNAPFVAFLAKVAARAGIDTSTRSSTASSRARNA
jgi:hypothetical protein